LATVGIIANPAAGKDIRRLVAHGRFVPNHEKVNILKRILVGLDAAGVERVVMMPDASMLGKSAIDGSKLKLAVEFLDMSVFNEERDSTKAAEMMAEARAGCIITLGGDGTNRSVAKSSGDVPLIPVSTGTNNVFPVMIEGTVAGMAAGALACGRVDLEKVSTVAMRLDIYVDGAPRDIALIDVAICRERFVGARAIWDMNTIHEIFLSRAEPASIGLSAIGAHLLPSCTGDTTGVYARLGPGATNVLVPVAPGMITPVGVEEWRPMAIGEMIEIKLRPCTVALDGERTLTLLPQHTAHVSLNERGPRVVSVEAVMREAALNGVFKSRTEIDAA